MEQNTPLNYFWMIEKIHLKYKIEEIQNRIKLSPSTHKLYWKLYEAYIQNEEPVQAVQILKKCLEKVNQTKEEETDTYNAISSIYYQIWNPEKAKEWLEKAIEIEPENNTLQENLKIISNEIQNIIK